MSGGHSYGSPTAFRSALTARLKEKAKGGRWTLQQLQRHIAYDRLLERLYLVDDGWVVKGAAALLARDIGVRATADIDVYRETARAIAETDLREAVARDIGDWFSFELGPPQALSDGAGGVRIPVTASIGPTVWASYHVDLVGADLRMTGEPEDVPPLARVAIPDVEQHGYRAYPLVDHIADKIAATLQQYGPMGVPSTRYKDLVDLVAIITEASVHAESQLVALRSEAERRGIKLPSSFGIPDRGLWERGYAAEAGRSLLTSALTLDEALTVVRPFIDPLLAGAATGRWDPKVGRWVEDEVGLGLAERGNG
ncbi:MAG: hypothetical protein A2Y55_08945 [Actinobacteria bacterium RBG_16_68_12]|nr:MAG: hypothetical protein A2Y55_08945 [Actinobacteria bacterium RBG_16_68_12]